MNKEHIQVITDKEELYDKCENMEQLYDKYYLPLLDIHFRKTYKLQQQNKKYKEVIDKLENKIKVVKQYDFDRYGRYELLDILKEVE